MIEKIPSFRSKHGTNPTIASYNASVVKIYSAVNSMARLWIKNYFSPIKYYLA
jgi:hypothetical protein